MLDPGPIELVGVSAYDANVPSFAHPTDAPAYPLLEGSNIGMCRRQLHDLFRAPGYDPLAASGMN